MSETPKHNAMARAHRLAGSGLLTALGWVVLATGLLVSAWSFAAPAARPMSDTVNYQLLNAKLIYAAFGAAWTVWGAMWIAADSVTRAIARAAMDPQDI